MDIDLIHRKNIFLTVYILVWLPQLLITDALEVSKSLSCIEKDTLVNNDSWPSPLDFEPLDPSTQSEFITFPTNTVPRQISDQFTSSRYVDPSSEHGDFISPLPPHFDSLKIEPTSTIIHHPTLCTSLPLEPSSTPLPPPSDPKHSSFTLEPSEASISSWFRSSVQSTPTHELDSRKLISTISSPFQVSIFPNRDITTSHVYPSKSIMKMDDFLSSRSVTSESDHRLSTPKIDDQLTTPIIGKNNDNETIVDQQQQQPSTVSPLPLDLTPFLTSPQVTSEVIDVTLSHNLNPTSPNLFWPVLSGTIQIVPHDPSTESPSTTDSTFPWTPIDNIIYYNNNNTSETSNHHEGDGDSQNHHGVPEAATSNTTKCDHRENQLTQPALESGFLVRSVLKRFDEESPLSLDNLTTLFEARLADVYNLAYRNQLKGLGVRPDSIKKDVHVKLWNLFWNNSTDHFHLIYSIEQDNHKLLARDLQTLLSHVSPEEMSNILGYNGTIKAEPYVNATTRKNGLASVLEDIEWLPFLMIFLSFVVFLFCIFLTLMTWRKNRRLRSSSPNSTVNRGLGHSELGNARLKSSISKPIGKINGKESLVNWRKVSGPGSKRSFLGSHGGSGVGLNISGGCSATSGTIDSNHEFEYLSFDSPTSSLKLRTAEYRPRRPFSAFPNQGSHSRIDLAKEKVIPIGELDEIAELSSNSSHDAHHHPHGLHHHHLNPEPSDSRKTYVTTKEEIIGIYENPLMRSGVDEVDCSVPQLIQVHISEQTQNIIQAIRSELKKFNPITGTNVQSQSQPTQLKESTSTSDA